MDFEKLKQQAAHYTKSPDKEVWRRLNVKLDENSKHQRVFSFSKHMRYVASFLLLAVSTGVLYFSDRKISVAKPVFEVSIQESMKDGIYSSDKMNDLYLAYRKVYVRPTNSIKDI